MLSSKGYRLRRVLVVRVLHCAGLMAWIVEKFRTWSDCNGDVESRFTKDELLTNVSLYWFNQNITSSTRLYYETMGPFAKKSFHRGPVKARTHFVCASLKGHCRCSVLHCTASENQRVIALSCLAQSLDQQAGKSVMRALK